MCVAFVRLDPPDEAMGMTIDDFKANLDDLQDEVDTRLACGQCGEDLDPCKDDGSKVIIENGVCLICKAHWFIKLRTDMSIQEFGYLLVDNLVVEC